MHTRHAHPHNTAHAAPSPAGRHNCCTTALARRGRHAFFRLPPPLRPTCEPPLFPLTPTDIDRPNPETTSASPLENASPPFSSSSSSTMRPAKRHLSHQTSQWPCTHGREVGLYTDGRERGDVKHTQGERGKRKRAAARYTDRPNSSVPCLEQQHAEKRDSHREKNDKDQYNHDRL